MRLLGEDVFDGLDLARVKTLVSSSAVSRGQLVSIHGKGRARRIESGSLAKWRGGLRKATLTEDIEVIATKRQWKAFH